MYPGFKPSTSASKTLLSIPNQSQLQTLQREVQTYTHKLQQQKKKYYTIQDNYKITLQEYEREKNKLNVYKKQNNKNHVIFIQNKIKNLQSNLEKAISVYDQTLTHNNKLKCQIDMLRRQKKTYTDTYHVLSGEIKQYQEEISKKINDINLKKNTVQLLKNGILDIKQKNQFQKQQYTKQFDNLQKDYLKQKKQRQHSKLQKIQKPSPIDTQHLLKYRLKKLIKANKNKIKMIDQYKKHMKLIQQAFNQIKKNTGIDNLQQITNIFIKSQQQNYSLYNYMDSLSRNIDTLQKSNTQLQKTITKQQQLQQQRKKNMQSQNNQQKKQKQLQQYLLKKQQASQQLNQLIQAIKPQLTSALLQLVDSSLNDDPSKVVEYELGITINDRTIQSYLSDLQKFVNNLFMLRKQIKPKTLYPMKQNITIYSKPIPNITTDQVSNRQKNGDIKDEQKLMDQNKFREYAVEYLEKRKNKFNGNGKD